MIGFIDYGFCDASFIIHQLEVYIVTVGYVWASLYMLPCGLQLAAYTGFLDQCVLVNWLLKDT